MKFIYSLSASLLIVFITLSSSSKTFGGPIVVGKGSGEGEYSVYFVYSNLNQILKECYLISCQFNDFDKEIFSRLTVGAKDLPSPILESSINMQNRLFELKEAKIFINQELLWQDQKKTIPYNVGDAIDLWLQILAHVNRLDLVETTTIRQKLKSTLMSETDRSLIEINEMGSVEYILWGQTAMDLLVIRDPQLNSIELNSSIIDAINCPLKGPIHLFSPAWLHINTNSTEKLEEFNLTLHFGIKWSCGTTMYSSRGFSLIKIKKYQKGIVRFDFDSLYTYVEQGE